jgi:spermidine synthase
VPILHSTASKYQSILIVEVPGQLGKCLLLDGTIQFCSHDLDAYTDHMARHPLQLLQAVRGCGPDSADRATKQHTSSGYRGKRPTAAAAANLQLLVTPAALAPAASASEAGHVTCRKSMLQPPSRLVQAAAGGGAAGNSSSADDIPACLGGAGQQKARVLLVGGGDGWIAGQLVSCYGDYVEHVTAVELDEMVSVVTEQHFRQIMHHGSPFKHPNITWKYTDAYAWALQKVAQCSSSIAEPETQASSSNSSSTTNIDSPASAATGQPDTSLASSAAQAAAAAPTTAAAGRRLESEDARNLKIAVTKYDSQGGSTNDGSKPAVHCAGFDLVIIDSTDFTVTAASKLHSEAFYAALHQLMRPQAALIQIVEIYLRVFEKDFVAMEGALRRAGWEGVGRSSVFVPSYSGEALMLHAVKNRTERGS